jgi:transmembrane sensor
MKPILTKKIIFDYFDGKSDINSAQVYRRVAQRSESNQELYFQYLDEWEQRHPQYIFNIDSGLKKVYQNIATPVNETKEIETPVKSIGFYSLFTMGCSRSCFANVCLVRLVTTKQTIFCYVRATCKKYQSTETGEIYEKENFTSKPILVNLPDKSSIILQPKSKICYSPRQYNKTKREVILSGEAFFEVQKNSKIPFFGIY